MFYVLSFLCLFLVLFSITLFSSRGPWLPVTPPMPRVSSPPGWVSSQAAVFCHVSSRGGAAVDLASSPPPKQRIYNPLLSIVHCHVYSVYYVQMLWPTCLSSSYRVHKYKARIHIYTHITHRGARHGVSCCNKQSVYSRVLLASP